jgi:hypothetical protein
MSAREDVRQFLRSALQGSGLADLHQHDTIKSPAGIREDPDGSFSFTHEGERFRIAIEAAPPR